MHTRIVHLKDFIGSCVCRVFFCFQAHVTVTGLFLPAIFTCDTNTFELLSQQPASIFYPGRFAPLLQIKTSFRTSLPTLSISVLLLFFFL